MLRMRCTSGHLCHKQELLSECISISLDRYHRSQRIDRNVSTINLLKWQREYRNIELPFAVKRNRPIFMCEDFYIDCMIESIRDDVLIDKCVDRCRKQETWYVHWSMQFSMILGFYALFRSFSVPDFRKYRQLFHVHASSRRPNKSWWMGFRMFDCYLYILDSFQIIYAAMCTLLHVHFDPMPDTFHVKYSHLHEGLEYLLRNTISTKQMR